MAAQKAQFQTPHPFETFLSQSPLRHTMYAFITVGSTRFDKLVQQALSDAVIDVLRAKGYSKIVVQCGNSEFDTKHFVSKGETWVLRDDEDIQVWKFKPSLQKEYEQADLVISHAGAPFPHSCFISTLNSLIHMGRLGDHH